MQAEQLMQDLGLARLRAVNSAVEAVPDPAKTELARLSADTLRDLRIELLKSLDQEERVIIGSVLAMRSSERATSRHGVL